MENKIYCLVLQDGVKVNEWLDPVSCVAWLVGAFTYNLTNKNFYKFKIKNDVLTVTYGYYNYKNETVKFEYQFYNIPFDSYGGVFNNVLCNRIKGV